MVDSQEMKRWRNQAGPTTTRITTGLACVVLCFLLFLAAPAQRPDTGDVGDQLDTPDTELAFTDEEPVAETASTSTTTTPVASTSTTTTSTSTTTTTEPPKQPRPARVLLVGDSIAHEIRTSLTGLLAQKGIALDTVTFPGLAPCDLAEPAAEAMAARPAEVVIVLFTGNAISPCMSEASDPTSAPYFEKYRADMTSMVATLSPPSGNPADPSNPTPDVWVVEPLPYAEASTNQTVAQLDQIFRSIDGIDGAIPIADLFTTSSGAFAGDLPCLLEDEPCPTVRVRSVDDVHLGDDGTTNVFGRQRLAFGLDRFIDNRYE